MNKIKALITAIVLASSSAAMASPLTISTSVRGSVSFSTGYQTRTSSTTVVRNRTPVRPASNQWFGRDYSYDRYDRAPRFDMLQSELNFGSGEYRKDIMPGINAGSFSTLKLTADRGRTYVMKVVVEFADGTSQQQINLDRTLLEGESLTLDLTGSSHTISRILVYRADGNQLAHFYERHRGEFSVLAK